MFIATRHIDGCCFGFRVAFVVDEWNAPVPDIGYLCPERAKLVTSKCVQGAPDLAVEMVSYDSIERDYELKREMYEAAGVAEYWIIDPIETRAEFLVLRGGRYEAAAL
jgi:Uma2 family endonuclease